MSKAYNTHGDRDHGEKAVQANVGVAPQPRLAKTVCCAPTTEADCHDQALKCIPLRQAKDMLREASEYLYESRVPPHAENARPYAPRDESRATRKVCGDLEEPRLEPVRNFIGVAKRPGYRRGQALR